VSRHPAYPSTADLLREADAAERDVADLVALRDLRRIVADAIARAGRFDGIRHPDRRWTLRTYSRRSRSNWRTLTTLLR
jgi:hypothetical protein